MNILFVAAEVSPLSKVGGLGDVAGSLTVALSELGHDVRIVTPNYSAIDVKKFPSKSKGSVKFTAPGGASFSADVRETRLKNRIPVYLIDMPEFFNRSKVYGEADDLERFWAFSQAAVLVPELLGWQPDVLHAHDWHAAISVSLMKAYRDRYPIWNKAGTVLTIHNLQYQGHLNDKFMSSGFMDLGALSVDRLANLNIYPSMMGLGLVATDVINTVSEGYSREILTPEFGYGMEPLLHQRQEDLVGVLNGIDIREFDPSKDAYLPFKFDLNTINYRSGNKAELQRKVGLEVRADVPVFGAVTRLADQKGIDILADAIPNILKATEAQFVILGNGNPDLEARLTTLTNANKGRMSAIIGFDVALGQLIYAGSDVFVMPSRFEPCGLGQMIALRYGSVPLVRQTGGLADTIQDCGHDLSNGNGFVFKNPNSQEIEDTMIRAVRAYGSRNFWGKLQQRGMAQDLSWDTSAQKYISIYKQAQGKRSSIVSISGGRS
ncbi:MAG: glycogen synthase [Dehalococcoidia bacterium]|nr:glycogen synthase [Dehalococcoidia bacterium]